MVVYDSQSKYGNNFYFCTTQEAFDREMKAREEFLNPPAPRAEEEEVVPKKKSGWESQGSDAEIVESRVVVDRKPVCLMFNV
jgi:hypothetical protein